MAVCLPDEKSTTMSDERQVWQEFVSPFTTYSIHARFVAYAAIKALLSRRLAAGHAGESGRLTRG
jgi:hypothetical protein